MGRGGGGLGADDANVLSMGLTSHNLLTGRGRGQKVQFSSDVICECSLQTLVPFVRTTYNKTYYLTGCIFSRPAGPSEDTKEDKARTINEQLDVATKSDVIWA